MPTRFDQLMLSAESAANQRDSERAIELYSMAIGVGRDQPLPYYKRGNLLKDSGQLDAALASYDQAVALDPGYANAYCNRGVVLERLERLKDAKASYDRAIALNPSDAFAYYNRAGVLQALARPEDALASFDLAIALVPTYAAAYCNSGLLLTELHRWDEALARYRRCIDTNPGFYEAYFHLGALLQNRGQLEAALRSYDSAIQIRHDHADAYCNRGVVLTQLGRWEDGLTSYDRAICLNANLAAAYCNRAEAFLHLNRFQDAVADYDRASSISPAARFVLGARLHAKMNFCDWLNLDADLASLEAAIAADSAASQPFYVLALLDSPRLQSKAAETWVREVVPPDDSLGPIPKRARHEKLRVGYFSPDFREHAIGHLIAGVIDTHDRSRFEVIGFSFGPDTQDKYRKRFERSFDRFIDVRTRTNLEIAALSRDLAIDIAVDLCGHTHLSRTGIFALRVAPVQVNYLGYPGTMGAGYVDYLIADETLVPPETARHYTESIIYLPHSYQATDSTRVIDDRVFTRELLGLPADAFVFCCFNNTFKILPSTFDRWMRILTQVPGSVLWLLAANETAANNLRRQASERKVEPNRLIFATRMPLSEHLARHRAADLFLDSLPYNAHTTASDALWAGLPLITCSGESFASRVAASLLRAIGLPELIATTPAHFEQLAVELALDAHRLAGVKDRLAKNRLLEPLFDTPLFTRHIEAAYSTIQERYLAGLPPQALHVASSRV